MEPIIAQQLEREDQTTQTNKPRREVPPEKATSFFIHQPGKRTANTYGGDRDKSGAPHQQAGIQAGNLLVQRRYAWRGYQLPAVRQDPNLFAFLAYDEGQLVGTVSVRLDSEEGLSADELYPKEVGALRSLNHRVCEFTRLAVDSAAATKAVLAGLFHTAYLYAAIVRSYTHAVIEVNPRHVGFYSTGLQFECIGGERLNKRVNAPATLLCVAFATIAAGIAKYAGRPEVPGARHSLFLYGFPSNEEAGVLNRLRALVHVN